MSIHEDVAITIIVVQGSYAVIHIVVINMIMTIK